MKPLANVGLIVVGFVGCVLFGSSHCAPQKQGRKSNYVVGEQSSGRVGTVEINRNSASNIRTVSNANVANYQPQQRLQVQSSPSRITAQQPSVQQVQSVPVRQQPQQSQYERELAQYRQALMAYQQQMVIAQPRIQYEQPQPFQPQPYQPQPYQSQPYQPQPYQPQPYQPQPYQPFQSQPFSPQPGYQPFSPYSQPNYYSSPFEMSSGPSSSSSLFGGLSNSFRSLTSGFGLGGIGLGLLG